jgi:hypothetical protein
MRIENPFDATSPVAGDRFVGRETELQKIVRAIRARDGQNVSIVGERRCGKSSILRQLQNRRFREENGLEEQAFALVYLLFYRKETQEEFARRVIENIRTSASGSTQGPGLRHTSAFGPSIIQTVKDVVERERRLVLLFDEFDYAATNDALRAGFLDTFRSISQTYGVTLVVSSRKGLRELCARFEDSLGSPFFNIFPVVVTPGLLELEAARKLVEGPWRGAGLPLDPEDLGFLLNRAGRHPYFLQLLAYHLFDAYLSDDTLPIRENRRQLQRWAETQAWSAASQNFSYYWGESESREKIALATYAVLGSGEKAALDRERVEKGHALLDPRALRRLEDRTLLAEAPDGHKRIFSPLFEEWILEELKYLSSEISDDFEAWRKQAELQEWPDKLDTIRAWAAGRFGKADGRGILLWLLEKDHLDVLDRLMKALLGG